jgi:pyruvate dehydrogenase E1 component beta subunit
MRRIRYNQAINEALTEEMARDEKVFILGEGVQTSTFGTLTGLIDQFGPERVMDTPMAETAIAGIAVGASLMGYRPIADLMFVDFMYIAADEIMLKAAQWRMMQGGFQSLPCVFLANMGGYRKLGNEHSRCPYSMFLHHPGLKVAVPADPYDAKGLLKSALREPNPVVVIEHKLLYNTKGPVPEEEYTLPLGQADVKRSGDDVTLVSLSRTVLHALEAAEQAAGQGLSVEVIDLRSTVPLDVDTIIASVQKTNRLVVAHEAHRRLGIGAEIAALVQERAFDYLDAPIERVGAMDIPIPYSKPLEDLALPGPEAILEALHRVTYGGQPHA